MSKVYVHFAQVFKKKDQLKNQANSQMNQEIKSVLPGLIGSIPYLVKLKIGPDLILGSSDQPIQPRVGLSLINMIESNIN